MNNEVYPDKKVGIFKEELDLIYDYNIRRFTEICLIVAPDYFFTDCPASSSGKYHPLDELSWDGCIIHTKRVVTVAYLLSRGLGCEEHRDIIVSGAIIHDLRKQGLERSGHTVRNHPDLAAKLVEDVQRDTNILNNNQFNMLRNCVGYHYGVWGSGKWVKPITDFSMEELCVYISDYIASKKELSVEYNKRFE